MRRRAGVRAGLAILRQMTFGVRVAAHSDAFNSEDAELAAFTLAAFCHAPRGITLSSPRLLDC